MDDLNATARLRVRARRVGAWLAAGFLVAAAALQFEGIAQQKSQASSSRVVSTSVAKNDNSGVEDFVSALVEAGDESKVRALLGGRPELVTGELWDAFQRLAGRASLYGDNEKADAIYRAMQVAAAQSGDAEGVARALIYNAKFLKDEETIVRAYRRSFEIGEAVGNKAVMGEAMCAMGQAFFRQGNQAAGFEHLRRGLELVEQSGEKALAARILSDLGAIYYLRGDYDVASDYFERSVVLSEDVGDRYLMAIARFHLGAVHRMRGEYAQALEMYLKSQKLLEEFGDTAALSSTLRHIGTTYYLQRDYRLALSYQERTLRIDEKLNDTQGIAYSLLYRGAIYSAQGRYAEAREDLEKGLKLFEALPVLDGAARALGLLGSVHHALGEHDAALKRLEQSLALRERLEAKDGIASTLLNIAIVHDARNNHAKALEYAEQAAGLARRIGSRQTLWGACTMMGKSRRALNQPAQARAAFDEAIAIIETMRAQVTGGEEERELFFEDKVYPYQQVIKTLLDEGKDDEAFVYAERAKARALLDVLGNGRMDFTGGMSEAERASERNLKRDYTSLNARVRNERLHPRTDAAHLVGLQKQLDRARLDYTNFQTNLYAAHPELKVRRGEIQAVTRDELLDLLPDEQTALVEYVVTDDRTFLFVFKRQDAASTSAAPSPVSSGASSSSSEVGLKAPSRVGLKVYAIDIDRHELSARVERLRQKLGQRNILFSGDACALYDLLLRPAEKSLQGVTRLIIVPDESLWELPFQALQPAAGLYVIENVAVSYAPSLTVLREMTRERRDHTRRPPQPQQTLLAFGDPSNDAATPPPRTRANGRAQLSPSLPEAQKLVRALASVYGAGRSRVYTGAEARERRFKAEAGRYRVVHLATHGVLNDANPMYSHVILTPETNDKRGARVDEDGLLEAWELMSLNLQADLVVLSACETARGGVRPGEGMIGLAWGLFVAGSPSAVVSQWKIDSASTTELMLEFHRTLSTREHAARRRKPSPTSDTKADALRTASLRLLRSEHYAHPFYWAGFVLIGDGF